MEVLSNGLPTQNVPVRYLKIRFIKSKAGCDKILGASKRVTVLLFLGTFGAKKKKVYKVRFTPCFCILLKGTGFCVGPIYY